MKINVFEKTFKFFHPEKAAIPIIITFCGIDIDSIAVFSNARINVFLSSDFMKFHEI